MIHIVSNRVGFTVACLVFALAAPISSHAWQKQQRPRAPGQLAVDVVTLHDQTKFYGVVTAQDDNEVTLVVEREWLETNFPDLYRDHLSDERTANQQILSQLISRIDDWIAERPDDANLKFFLEEEREKAAAALVDAGTATRFTWMKFPVSDVRRVVRQRDDQRKIALVAWKHNLADVASRTARSLAAELKQQQIDVATEDVKFTGDIPGQPQTDQQWAIRKGIVEFQLREPLEFQGTGDSFFRQGEEVNPLTLVRQMMQQGSASQIQQIGEELGLPEFTNRQREQEQPRQKDWWKRQAEIADDEGFRSFQMTRLNQNLLRSVVSVDVVFLVKDHEGQWRVAHQATGQADANNQSADDMEQLREDPQVQQIIELMEGLGLANNGQLERALSHGLATQVALQRGRDQMQQFVDLYADDLSSPPIEVPKD